MTNQYPAISVGAVQFARRYTEARLIEFFDHILDAQADSSDASPMVTETNRMRLQRGLPLSGNALCATDAWGYREPGTLADLFYARLKEPRSAEVTTWADVWNQAWQVESLAQAHVVAELAIRGEVNRLAAVAGTSADQASFPFSAVDGDIADELYDLAVQSFGAWTEREWTSVEPDELLDMGMSVTAIPHVLAGAERTWGRIERLALEIAGADLPD
ncbi:hypothetical protein [Mycobacteroides abscessus]|uniref:hypothetical protein n=1 Tax=Mycobacteroides abscessus TaxID=36809 RepID=UPI000C267A48|nr:hypothetical protein [Mycobacteroides abscessus]